MGLTPTGKECPYSLPLSRTSVAINDSNPTGGYTTGASIIHSGKAHVNEFAICVFNEFEMVRPGGAFYAFIKAPGEAGATEFVEKAIKNNVLIIPGNVFSEKDTHFRISYATTDEKIRQGVEILCSLIS